MFGRGGDLAEQVERLERDVDVVKVELGALHHRRKAARQDEVRAWSLLEAAHANQHRIDIAFEEQLAALASLRQEIETLLPDQCGPVD